MRKQETAEGLFSSPATYPLYYIHPCTVLTQDYALKLKLEFSEVDIVEIKTDFRNFEEIPFPRKSLKKGKYQPKMLPGNGECHIYIFLGGFEISPANKK